jgi:hypothetical protein
MKTHWVATLSLSTLLVLLTNSFTPAVFATIPADDSLFTSVWDESLCGYRIVSNKTFLLRVYILSLPDVGNYRIINHSEVVEGARQAVKIRQDLDEDQVKTLHISLYGVDLVLEPNVTVSCGVIDSWEAYKALVLSGNNTVIVNTHDEYVPVPNGYTKEVWVDKIADFMLNRWGTWVHAGGYSFYRVWYQNETKEEWGPNGFKQLMKHIGKPNVELLQNNNSQTLSLGIHQSMGYDWKCVFSSFPPGLSLSALDTARYGFSIRDADFGGLLQSAIYRGGCNNEYCYAGAAIRFSQNWTSFHFGVYVHLGALKFFPISGGEYPPDFVLGFLSTAVAVSEEFVSPCTFYGYGGNSATEAIRKAEREGRTNGLEEAKKLFENALDEYAAGNYKLARAYAEQSKRVADSCTTANALSSLVVVAAVALIGSGTVAGTGVYCRVRRRRREHEHDENKEQGMYDSA